jgi:hypothetical protein
MWIRINDFIIACGYMKNDIVWIGSIYNNGEKIMGVMFIKGNDYIYIILRINMKLII